MTGTKKIMRKTKKMRKKMINYTIQRENPLRKLWDESVPALQIL